MDTQHLEDLTFDELKAIAEHYNLVPQETQEEIIQQIFSYIQENSGSVQTEILLTQTVDAAGTSADTSDLSNNTTNMTSSCSTRSSANNNQQVINQSTQPIDNVLFQFCTLFTNKIKQQEILSNQMRQQQEVLFQLVLIQSINVGHREINNSANPLNKKLMTILKVCLIVRDLYLIVSILILRIKTEVPIRQIL